MLISCKNIIEDNEKKSGISMPVHRNFSIKYPPAFKVFEYILPLAPSKTQQSPLLYGIHATKFGKALILSMNDTLAGLYFCEEISEETVASIIAPNFKSMPLVQNDIQTRILLEKVLAGESVPVTLIGSPFEISVWKALLQIPKGHVTHYQEIARTVGRPKAVRAVASAIGRNPISLVVPCHRVIRSNGNLGGYRFGLNKKLELLKKEMLYKQHNFKT